MMQIAGSVDFGGTKLMVGLVNQRGEVLARDTVPTPRDGGPAVVAETAAGLLRGLAQRQGVALDQLVGVGATVPGLADSRAGILRYAPAHGWRDVPFAQMLVDRLQLPVRIANDVNACALAEQRFGAGRGVANLLWLTISTGIGGGLVLNGQMYEGSGGVAGEVGHLVVEEGGPQCGCGHHGCLEAVAAGPAIARRARDLGLSVDDAREVAVAARNGDPVAVQVMIDTATYLGRAIAFCWNLLDPDMVVLGGGVAQSLELMLPVILTVMQERTILLPERPPRIAKTELGYEAALIGAAALVL
ncbi:MAG: ROK family protein [Mycobacterium leprae]